MTDSNDREEWEEWASRALSGKSLHEPGRGVLHRAKELSARWQPTAGRDWLAWLIFDSSQEPLPAGIRSGPSVERRVLFGLGPDADGEGEVQLDLRLRRDPGKENRLEMTGQLLPPPQGAAVSVRVGNQVRRARLDPSCSFVLGGLPAAGQAELTIQCGGNDPVELPPVPLGA